MSTTDKIGLVGDIGGTNARFALVSLEDGCRKLNASRSLLCRDYPTVTEALKVYLAEADAPSPSFASIAVAGPVEDRAIRFTNLGWAFSEAGLEQDLGFERANLLNDYAALAIAAPMLQDEDVFAIGAAKPAPGTIAILGAGTGFGVSALARDADGETVLSTEGGHAAFAPTDSLEIEILKVLLERFVRVSIERLLSGPGLVNLYQAICLVEDRAVLAEDPETVSLLAAEGNVTANDALDRFCEIMGSVAGDHALAFGARGGVLIAGGIAPRMLDRLSTGGFRARFEDKGRFRDYNAGIATRVITHSNAALLGAARKVRQLARAT